MVLFYLSFSSDFCGSKFLFLLGNCFLWLSKNLVGFLSPYLLHRPFCRSNKKLQLSFFAFNFCFRRENQRNEIREKKKKKTFGLEVHRRPFASLSPPDVQEPA